jgi:3-oxoacyl-[acyl-carrier protein] reductase
VASATELPIPTYPDLEGQVAVVTGGSKGIGAATCRVLAANGVRVAVVARDPDAIDTVVSDLRRAGAEAVGISADVTDLGQIERTRRQVEDELGPPDVLVPFAGGFGRFTAVHDITEEEWHFVVESNLTSTFLTCKAFLPGMLERGRGAIVTMATNGARVLDIPLTASYAAAKAGVMVFTRHLAKEVGPRGVRANCVAPATTLTERTSRILSEERKEELAELAPLGRMGIPEDTALATLFLASSSAAWLTGVTLDVAGGRIMV